MSETLLRFLLEELKTVRILCQSPGCQGIIEWPVEKLRAKFAQRSFCPLCMTDFGGPPNASAIAELGKAIEWLKAMESTVRVEFVLPENRGGA